MHLAEPNVRYNTPRFLLWCAAEQCACAAERKLFSKLLGRDARSERPTREEAQRARELRSAASALMRQMVDEKLSR